jgi:nitric oxide reductase activation protein
LVAEYEKDGIANEAYSSDQGRLIGLRLMQELKFKDGSRHRLDDGELNVETVIENMQENRGILNDFNVFSEETPLIHDHTVLIMIDMSGSMRGDDIRIARSAALMLAKALEEMNVPYSIRGFGAVSRELVIKDYVIKDFDSALDLPKLRSMFMGDTNRDSDSLRHAIEILSSERGKKLIFVISDGHPNHPDGVDGYRSYNNQAFMDMFNLVREADREGISVIGVGINQDAEAFIAGTYLKGFYIEKMDELPEKLVKIYLQESAGFRTWKSCIL